ncbi:MAG: hypothetical protein ACI4JB_06890, partial [Porcipelethomonas sp.]
MRQNKDIKIHSAGKIKIRLSGNLPIKILALLLFVILLLCGCSKNKSSQPAGTEKPTQTDSQNSQTDTEPVTLEQELLKRRGKPFDQSDYKKLTGGENIIDVNSEFDCELDHGNSKTIDSIVVSNGKIDRANFNSLLTNGKNIQEVGALPKSNEVMYWRITYDGEMGKVYYRDGTGYDIGCAPYSTKPIATAKYPLF